jgi:hypothetical protein
MTNTDKQIDDIDRLIEQWVIIDFKDADYVKQAKFKARLDFKAAIKELLTAAKVDEATILNKPEEL